MAPNTGYETLIYDCMTGDATLFQRADNVEAGWRAMQPVLDVWAKTRPKDFPTMPRVEPARPRPTRCWRATDAPGARLTDRSPRESSHDAKTESLIGPGGRRRHACHRGQGADEARSGRRPAAARCLARGRAGKAKILSVICAGGSQVPAARVNPVGELIWFVDRAAAGAG